MASFMTAVRLPPLNVPGASETECFGINNLGDIVGLHFDATGTHGFVYDGNTYTTRDVPGALDTQVNGINDSGIFVGGYTDVNLFALGFVSDGSTYTTVNVPDALNSAAFGVNRKGTIGGTRFH